MPKRYGLLPSVLRLLAIRRLHLARRQIVVALPSGCAMVGAMGDMFDQIEDRHRAFIEDQLVFFVATAPEEGRINLSPKGLDTFLVLGPNRVAYLDLTGSGNETAAHLAQNGRITFMFCGFKQKPLILRLYGRGHSVTSRDPSWGELISSFTPLEGTRQIIVAEIDKVHTSCGFGVPRFEGGEERETLKAWAQRKGPEGVTAYQDKENRESIDGLPTFLFGDK